MQSRLRSLNRTFQVGHHQGAALRFAMRRRPQIPFAKLDIRRIVVYTGRTEGCERKTTERDTQWMTPDRYNGLCNSGMTTEKRRGGILSF